MAGLKFMLSNTKRDFRLKGSATAFYINNSVTAPNLALVLLFYSDLHDMYMPLFSTASVAVLA